MTTSCLGDFLKFKYGKSLPMASRNDGDVPVYGSNGVIGGHSDAITKAPVIIVGRKGSIGELHYSAEPVWPIDTTYFVDDFGNHSPQFWFRYLRHLNLGDLNKATAIPGLNREDAYELLVLVPTTHQQHQIADELIRLETISEAAREELQHIPKLVERHRQAVLASAWNEPSQTLKNDSRQPWRLVTVADISAKIVDCPHSTPRWSPEGKICIRTTNFLPGRLDLREVRYVSPETYEERTARLEPRGGDVLYSREGGILGIACQIPADTELCLGQRMMLIRADPAKYNSTLLMHVLNSPQIVEKVEKLTGGSAAPHLNVGEIKKFTIPFPPREIQDLIVHQIDRALKLSNDVLIQAARSLSLLDRLERSFLKRAFGP